MIKWKNTNKKNITISNKENKLYFKFDNVISTCISEIFIVIGCNKCVIERNSKKYNYERMKNIFRD